jgi:hypothetical protein
VNSHEPNLQAVEIPGGNTLLAVVVMSISSLLLGSIRVNGIMKREKREKRKVKCRKKGIEVVERRR